MKYIVYLIWLVLTVIFGAITLAVVFVSIQIAPEISAVFIAMYGSWEENGDKILKS